VANRHNAAAAARLRTTRKVKRLDISNTVKKKGGTTSNRWHPDHTRSRTPTWARLQ